MTDTKQFRKVVSGLHLWVGVWWALSIFGNATAIAVTLTTSLVPPEFAEKHYFNQEREFPNLFLPAQYRGMSPESIPPAVVQESRAALEAALQALHRRMDWSMFVPGQVEPQNLKLLPYLVDEARKVDPKAKLYTSGGVLRSMFSYLYREMLDASRGDPGFDGVKFLRQFAKDTTPISDGLVRGVGSDLDLLIANTSQTETIKKGVLVFVNHGLETRSGEPSRVPEERLGLVRTIFPQGDVKDYDSQISRSSSEGGSTLDWLAFDLETAKFVEPARDTRVIDNFIRGRFTYLGPTHTIAPREHAGTVLRGIRPMLELPFLKVNGEDTFRAEVREQIRWMAGNGNAPGAHDLMQLSKMSRNSIYGAAQNRLYRTRPGTLDDTISDWLKKIQASTKTQLPIAAYQEEIAGRVLPKGGRVLPPNAFMSMNDFLKKYTKNGILYHGTKTEEGMLSILRGGFQISMAGKQGTAVNGSGVYTTADDESTALSYANGDRKRILSLKIRADQGMRILDWQSAKNLSEFQEMQKWCDRYKIDFNEYLAREHHVDIIVNGHVIVQNGRVFDLDKIDEQFASVRSWHLDKQKRFYDEVKEKILSGKMTVSQTFDALKKAKAEGIYDGTFRREWVSAFLQRDPNNPSLGFLFLENIKNPDDGYMIAKLWMDHLRKVPPFPPEVFYSLMTQAKLDPSRIMSYDEWEKMLLRLSRPYARPDYYLNDMKLLSQQPLEWYDNSLWYKRATTKEAMKTGLLSAEKAGMSEAKLATILKLGATAAWGIDGSELAFARPTPIRRDSGFPDMNGMSVRDGAARFRSGTMVGSRGSGWAGPTSKDAPKTWFFDDPDLVALTERVLSSGKVPQDQMIAILRQTPPSSMPKLYQKLSLDTQFHDVLRIALGEHDYEKGTKLYQEVSALLVPQSTGSLPAGGIAAPTVGTSTGTSTATSNGMKPAAGASVIDPNEAKFLSDIEVAMTAPKVDSRRVTDLISMLRGQMSEPGKAKLAKIAQDFSQRKDFVSGYSYMSRGFYSLGVDLRRGCAATFAAAGSGNP